MRDLIWDRMLVPRFRLKKIAPNIGCALLLTAGSAHAEHVWNLLVENDLFTGSDRHYTSGVMLNYIYGVQDGPRRLRDLGVRFPGIDDEDDIHISFSLGNEIYTPSDIHATALLPDDRPYAGYLYFATGFSTANAKEIETWRVSIGLIGPNARGETIQNNVHRVVGSDPAQGWANQLDNEWIFDVAYEKKWLNRAWTASEDWSVEADFIPRFIGAIGTKHDYVGVGGVFRIGYGLQNDYGPPQIRPSLPLSQFYDTRVGNSFYLFLGMDGRYVAHNVFLDGNTFRDSHSVDRNDWVGELQTGFVWNNRRFRMGYTYVIRSREFKQQDEHDIFGSVTFSLHF